jgi:hypothetical protein
MFANRKIIPLVITFFFLCQHFCFAEPVLFLKQDSPFHSSNYLSLIEKNQTNRLLADRTSEDSEPMDHGERGLDAEKLHKYLGYATVLLVGLTAVTGNNKDIHYGAAYSTIAASLGTIATGYLAHGDRLTFEDGIFTEDNNHILSGTLGALACIAAVALADSSGGHDHDAIGIVGGSAMALSVVTIRW